MRSERVRVTVAPATFAHVGREAKPAQREPEKRQIRLSRQVGFRYDPPARC